MLEGKGSRTRRNAPTRPRTPAAPGAARRSLEDLAFLLLSFLVVVLPAWLRSGMPGKVDLLETNAAPLRIDVNRAPWYEWTLLDGIGEVRAKRIVEHRETSGPFRSLEDLARVPRMPEGWLESAREHLTVGK